MSPTRCGRRSNAAKQPQRPITFVFNGGPGAASAYLHLGALGPRVIATGTDGEFLPSPQRLIDNPDTWLGMTDLVFVDPVGTGYSREAPGQEHARLLGRQPGCQFDRRIHPALSCTERPHRIAALPRRGKLWRVPRRTACQDPAGGYRHQPERHRADLAGAGIHACAAGRIRAAALGARTALAGGGAPARRRRQRRCACASGSPRSSTMRWATTSRPWPAGWSKAGGWQASAWRRSPACRSTSSSGISRVFRRGSSPGSSRAQAAMCSAPMTARSRRPTSRPSSARIAGPDPVLDRSVPVLTSAFVAYVRDELNFRTDVCYRLLNGEISRNWDYGTSASRQGYAGVMDDLQRARALEPGARRADRQRLHRPGDALYGLALSGEPDPVAHRMPSRSGSMSVEGGHMMYFRPDGRRALKEAASELYQATQ